MRARFAHEFDALDLVAPKKSRGRPKAAPKSVPTEPAHRRTRVRKAL